MRLRRIAPAVWVAASPVWRTTCTIAGYDGRLIIDGPVTPAEVVRLGGAAAPARALATHADWDHLLGPAAFPDARREAGAATIRRVRDHGTAIAAELAAWDRRHGWPERPLPDWTSAVALPPESPGPPGVGTLVVIEAPGHTSDGVAVLMTGAGVLVAGDYLSPVEIPALEGPAGIRAYLATLDRLGAALARTRIVVPGHGWPIGTARARTILAADRRYLETLVATGDAPLPRGGTDPEQRARHRANRARVAGGGR